MNVLIVAPIGVLSKRPRAYKLCNYLNRLGGEITHWGWDRDRTGAEEKFDFPVDKRIVLKGGGYSNSRNKLMYVFWMMAVFFRSFLIKKDTVVWAIGFESAFPLLLASKIRRFKVIFDDADRFSMVFNFPTPIKQVIESFEKVCSRSVVLHIIPNKSRYDFESKSFFEVKNMPAKADVERARCLEGIYVANPEDITVYVNGLVEGMRGIDTLLVTINLLDKWKDRRVSFLVAGAVRGELAQDFVELDRVKFLGNLDPVQALACYRDSDFVLTYYSPRLKINKYAESNKWGDALKMGGAVIVNSEVKTSLFLKELGCAYDFPYDDAEGLARFLVNVQKDEIQEKKRCALQGAVGYPDFDTLLERCFERVELNLVAKSG